MPDASTIAGSSPRWTVTTRIAAVTIAAVEAAKLILFFAAGPATIDSDAANYWNLGQQVASGDFWMAREPIAYRTPGYPWLIGGLIALCGNSAWGVLIALQHAAVAWTTWLIFRITEQVSGSLRLGLLAATLAACSLARPGYACVTLTETLFTAALTTTTWQLLRYVATGHTASWIAFLAGFVLCCLLRPVGQVLLLAVFFGLAITWWTRSRRQVAVNVGLAIVIVSAGLCPWIARNMQLFGGTALTEFVGRELWVATFGSGHPGPLTMADGPVSTLIREELAASPTPLEWSRNWSVAHALTDAGYNDAEADRVMYRICSEAIRQQPLRWLARWVTRQVDYWRSVFAVEQAHYGAPTAMQEHPHHQQNWGGESARYWRTALLLAAPASRLIWVEFQSLLAFLGLTGLLLSRRTHLSGLILLCVIGSIAGLTATLENPDYRYRLVLEPLLLVATVAGLSLWWKVVRLGWQALRESEVPPCS